MITTYECAITGLTAEGGESGPLGTLPPGWFKVTFARQVLNPKWVAIQQLKEAMINNVLAQIPRAEDRVIQQVAISLQVEAQYAALESQTPRFTTLEETIYTAPPESAGEILEAFNSIREPLGLEPLTDAEDGDEDEEAAPAAEGEGGGKS
jgi:hypothetical protein